MYTMSMRPNDMGDNITTGNMAHLERPRQESGETLRTICFFSICLLPNS